MLNAINAAGVINSPVRTIEVFVNVYENGTVIHTFTHNDRIIKFNIQRTAKEGRFFGFGFCQRLNLHLIDTNKELELTTACELEVGYNIAGEVIKPYPNFKVSECRRDEKTNELSITGYDAIYNTYTVADVVLTFPATVADYATLAAQLMGLTVVLPESESVSLSYEEGANYAGTESLRDLLDDIAEITQSIFYINSNKELVFKQLIAAEPALTITKENYINLDSGTARRLSAITHVNELGDAVTASLTITGTTQFMRSNGFIDMRDDVATILDNALAVVGGLSIGQFDMEWRGNPLLELGDYLAIQAKDNTFIHSFLLDTTVEYNGSLKEKTKWAYTEDSEETANNPTNLGEALNQTFARVDKAAKEVEIVVSEVAENSQSISTLQLTTGGISADVAKLDAEVNAKITADDVKIEVKRELAENGIDKVITNTGFVFDDVGLTVSKSGTEMTTLISEDGMTVYKNGDEMLKADNVGVVAKNLHATTYLLVGTYSRFEDYGSDRTGCFWMGG